MHCLICKKKITTEGAKKYCSYKCYGKSKIGSIPWNKGTKGVVKAWNKGKPWSEETKKKMSLAKKGYIPWHKGKKGHPQTVETRKKLSEYFSQKNHWNWQGGKTEDSDKIKRGLNYRLWREAVFARDDWTCQQCGKRGGNLEADHIKPQSLYPQLRFAIDNGRTLCINCHRQTDTFGWRYLWRQ